MRFFSSLRGRLLVLALGIEALMLTLMVANSLRLLSGHMGEQARRQAEQLTPVLMAAITAPLLQKDYSTVRAVLEESKAAPGIDYVAVTDNFHRVVAQVGWPEHQPLPPPDLKFDIFDDPEHPRYDVVRPLVFYGQPLGQLHFGFDLRHIGTAYHQLFLQGSGIATLELLLSAALLILLGLFLTRHLMALTRASREVASGNLTPDRVPQGRDEIGELGAAFNTMSAAVAQRIGQLTAARDEQMALARAAAAGTAAKTTFLANMSHEIRTPLNAILGYSQLALRRAQDAEQREQLLKVGESARHLLAIINDILDLSKIEAGKLQLEERDFLLEQLVENVFLMVEQQARLKNLFLSRQIPPGLTGPLRGDPLKISQILLNFLSNALKFTERGSVTLEVQLLQQTQTQLQLRFAVRDSGIGISPTQQQRLFESFEQGDASSTRRHGGTGLGLVICRHLAQLMGGQIGVDSQPGVGSCFWFTATLGQGRIPELPLPAQPAALTFDLGPAERQVRRLYAGRRILVVEDNPVNRDMLLAMLRDSGLMPLACENGAEALSLLAEQPCDLVLMDVQMPVMDGLEATRSLRCQPRFAELPIIAITANAFREDRENCLQAGMNDHLGKPVEAENLFTLLLKWLPPSTTAAETPSAAQPISTAPSPPFSAASGAISSTTPGANTRPAALSAVLPIAPPQPAPPPAYPADDESLLLQQLRRISGLNPDAALRQLRGRVDHYALLLRNFSSDHRDDGRRLQQLIADNDLDMALVLAHSLKGVAANIRASRLHALSSELDQALREKRSAAEQKHLASAVGDELGGLCLAIDTLFRRGE